MLKVKIFYDALYGLLEDKINEWLALHKNIAVERTEFKITTMETYYMCIWYYE